MGINIKMENQEKFEELTSFLQKEISQLNDEVFSQQKDIINLKNEISILKKRIAGLEEELDSNIDKNNQKPPHY